MVKNSKEIHQVKKRENGLTYKVLEYDIKGSKNDSLILDMGNGNTQKVLLDDLEWFIATSDFIKSLAKKNKSVNTRKNRAINIVDKEIVGEIKKNIEQ
jgi:hypothetical protein